MVLKYEKTFRDLGSGFFIFVESPANTFTDRKKPRTKIPKSFFMNKF